MVIEKLANDLRLEFPGMKGLSRTNLLYMRKLAATWLDEEKVPQLVGQIPWGHNRVILDRVKNHSQREWYIKQTIEHGWTRAILNYQIDSHLFDRKGKGLSNFDQTLPEPQSALAQQILKDPFNFDFLDLGTKAKERDIHQGLLCHLREFLLELGAGFAFVGSEVHIEVEQDDFFIDLLFYHLHLRCYVVIELKTTDFKPEHAGKLNFYLSAVDDMLRHPDDQPSIGLIICRGKKKLIAEYSLRDMKKPMGVTEHRLSRILPKIFKEQLPSIGTLEAELTE